MNEQSERALFGRNAMNTYEGENEGGRKESDLIKSYER